MSKNSPSFSDVCPTCLSQFIVNFRRPNDYRGQYGFDWLREDYIYPNMEVSEIKRKAPLSKNVQKLKQEYRKDVISPISPYGKEYFPAWLSLFSYIPNKKDSNISDMTKNGVQLDLHFEEIEKILDDGTEIILEASNEFIQVTPTKIRISEVLKQKRQQKVYGSKSVNYYNLSRKVNIKCTGGWLKKHEQVRVFAKKNNKKEEIGKLMLYRNDKVKHADIIIIPVVTDYANGKPLIPPRVDSYEYLIKKISFNQALIRAEIKRDIPFDLVKYVDDDLVQDLLRAPYGANAGVFANLLREIYNKYGPVKVHGGIDGNGKSISSSKKTFIFLTTKQTNAGGICTLDGQIWGDMVIVFKSNLNHAHSYPHELGHSFSLPHTFQPGTMHEFYRGYTENYMDYMSTSDDKDNYFHLRKKPFSFYKWQWDIMRQDKSMG